jgi:hypothetical protein
MSAQENGGSRTIQQTHGGGGGGQSQDLYEKHSTSPSGGDESAPSPAFFMEEVDIEPLSAGDLAAIQQTRGGGGGPIGVHAAQPCAIIMSSQDLYEKHNASRSRGPIVGRDHDQHVSDE